MLRIYAFTCGWLQGKLSFFLEGGSDEVIRGPVPAYLIDHPSGRALFDTGFSLRRRKEADFRLGPQEVGFEFDESADIAARLRAIDIDPGSIQYIINSHLHSDHCGGNASIPNATIIIQSRELAAARASALGPAHDPTEFDLGHPVMAIDGEHDLFGDGSVVLFPTFGHTPGHQSARIKMAGGDIVLASDCCYLRRSLDEMHLPANTLDREASLETLRRLNDMRAKGSRIFFGHDGDLWKSVPQGVPLI